MADKRINEYGKFLRDMQNGRYEARLAVQGADSFSQLGAELNQLAAALEQRARESNRIYSVADHSSATNMLDDVLEFIYDSFKNIIPFERIGFSLLNDDGGSVEAHWFKTEMPAARLGNGYSQPLAGSSLQRIIETGEPRILNDLEDYLKKHPLSESTRLIVQEGFRSSLTCPLVIEKRPVGFLFFSSNRRDAYKNIHVRTFQHIASQLSLVLQKAGLYQQLISLNKEKSRLLGIAAHDLRNPLAGIIGLLEILLEELQPGESLCRELAQSASDACNEMIVLLDNLLDVKAIETGTISLRPQNVELPLFFSRVERFNKNIARGKSIELEFFIAPELTMIVFDSQRIMQALNNLISNAIKFSQPHTRVTVSAAPKNDLLVISVADHGKGIPAEELGKLFKEYGRTSVLPTGGERSTGLGLAIVKRIITSHGGAIGVKSEAGKGSVFTITLPLKGSPEMIKELAASGLIA